MQQFFCIPTPVPLGLNDTLLVYWRHGNRIINFKVTELCFAHYAIIMLKTKEYGVKFTYNDSAFKA